MDSKPPSYENYSKRIHKYYWLIVFLAIIPLLDTQVLFASTRAEKSVLQKTIIDYRQHLNPRFKKRVRTKTKYILVHTSEGGLASTLSAVSLGKVVSGRRSTPGGHTHYVIARDGRVFRTLDPKYRADHAGLSMWNGEINLSNMSIGIELVGYHYADITVKQYRSLGILIDLFQDRYGLNDNAVLTHSQVAYGRPNHWYKTNHRGRKRCADNLDREKAGLKTAWNYDPDVRAGRLTPDPTLVAIFYEPRTQIARAERSNIITKTNSAWTIAGEDYDSSDTWYKLPDGRMIAGDMFDKKIGWSCIPQNTVVLLNQEERLPEKMGTGPIKTITDGLTAWTLAGPDYNKETTIYFFPDGHIRNGRQIPDWDEMPSRTKLLVGYKGPYRVTDKRASKKSAGPKYAHPDAVYLLADKGLMTGDQIKDFSKLPKGTSIFLPI